MWPIRFDMSRDESKKYLRYLELDAYGNMVSVLRAQGSFTDEKQRLLQELAKVLHISNERHRAEVRRAVNDEKLSTIAEQLYGPNTGIDWAIEGRRTIPLLPRLKGHTCFTGLANSLSVVTAAANEKLSLTREGTEDIKVKIETQSHMELDLDEKAVSSILPLPTENHVNSRKRKFLHEPSDAERDPQLNNNGTSNNECMLISTTCRDPKSPSPLPTSSSSNKVIIVSSSSSLDSSKHNLNEKSKESVASIPRSTTSVSYHQNVTILPFSTACIGSNSTVSCKGIISQTTTYSHVPAQSSRNVSTTVPTYITSTAKTKPKVMAVQAKINPRVAISADKTIQMDNQDAKPLEKGTNIIPVSNTTLKKSRSGNANYGTSYAKRIGSLNHYSTKPLVATKSLSSGGSRGVIISSSSSTASSGPGPPQLKSSKPLLTYKKLPSTRPIQQPTAKMGITLNSNKTLNVSPNPNARLAAKANVIVVQKGPARGVTLSHAGKEVLGKVIMGGKNLCLQNQQSASSVALLPHRVSTNGDQAVTTMLSTINLSQPETAKSSIKDISERNNKVLSQFVETSTIFSTDPPKTAIINPISHGATKEICNDDSISNKTLHMNCSVTSNFTIEQKEHKQRKSKENSTSPLIIENTESYSIGRDIECKEMLTSPRSDDNEIQGTLDPQTGIYSIQSTGDAISKVHIEENMSNAGLDIFSTALASADINLESLEYMEDDDNEEGDDDDDDDDHGDNDKEMGYNDGSVEDDDNNFARSEEFNIRH